MVDTTVVYPKPGVTLYLPGGVHGFGSAYKDSGVRMPTEHANKFHALGGVETAADRQAALAKAKSDLAAAEAEVATTETAAATVRGAGAG